jgi:hypothetical protein
MISRRKLMLQLAAGAGVAGGAAWWWWPREEAVPAPVVEWEQLIPAGLGPDKVVRGIVPHDGLATARPAAGDEADAILKTLVTAWDGKRIRMPGYTVPLDISGPETHEFLLVPYVGACIHVPPPPPNQIVYVTSVAPVDLGDMFDPVWVTGTMRARALSVEIADVGYHIEAESVTPYS